MTRFAAENSGSWRGVSGGRAADRVPSGEAAAVIAQPYGMSCSETRSPSRSGNLHASLDQDHLPGDDRRARSG